MKSLEEVYTYINIILTLDVNDETINELKNFIKVSPEKLSDSLGIERGPLTKEFDVYKKQIHNKIIIYDKVKKLKDIPVSNFNFKYGNETYYTKIAICIEYFTFKYKSRTFKFYPSIKYLYCDDIKDNNIIFIDNVQIHISNNEFENYFENFREFNLNKLLNDK